MISPFTGGEAILVKEPKELEFRGSKFHIIHLQYQCVDTGEMYTDTRLDELNLNQVYNQYREKEGIPFPDEIAAYRKQFDLPATRMSQILGFGVNMYGKYESGEIPNLSNGKLITICKEPSVFKNYFNLSRSHQFTDKEKELILRKIDRAIESKQQNIKEEFEKYAALGNTERGINTGYADPNLNKAKQMVVFFASLCKPFTTKMNKLLYYSDFLNFKRTGFSISGIAYQAIPYGPVPLHYGGLYEHFLDVVERKEEYFEEYVSGEKLISTSVFDESLFTSAELKSLETVGSRFKNTSTKDIIMMSHDEPAWIENERTRDIISYQYAFDLKAFN